MCELRKQTQYKGQKYSRLARISNHFACTLRQRLPARSARQVCPPGLQATRTSSFGRENFAAIMKSAPALSGLLGTPSS